MGKKFFRALAMHGGVTVPSKPKKPCAYPGCPALVTDGTVRSMQEKQTAIMKNSAEISRPNAVMDVRGKESVTSTLQSIHSVRSVMSMDFWFR